MISRHDFFKNFFSLLLSNQDSLQEDLYRHAMSKGIDPATMTRSQLQQIQVDDGMALPSMQQQVEADFEKPQILLDKDSLYMRAMAMGHDPAMMTDEEILALVQGQ